jgi:hypothetical protein
MPYIKPEKRKIIDKQLEHILMYYMDEGELNYIITKMLNKCTQNWGESYATYNKLTGVLETCKLELYRRKIAPYEDKKISENGDVY